MNFRLIRNIRRKGRSDVLPVAVFLAAIVVFHVLYPATLGSLASRIASPFWHAERFLAGKLEHGLGFFSSKETLIRDVEELSATLKEADELLRDRESLQEENKLLREAFGRSEYHEKRLLGAVLALPPRSLYDTVIIDIGTREGVSPGAVALAGGTILGEVRKAYPITSVVELFSNAGRKTAVVILHEGTGIPVEGVGRGSGEFSATLPREVTVAIGDKVVMPGLNPTLFARVEAIEGSVTDSFQTIRFKNPVSLQTLRFLEIRAYTLPESRP